MKKHLLGPALAALAAFTLGFLYWGLPHHLPYKTLGKVADESATALAIGQLFPASGAYLLPSPLLGEEKMNELALRGPSVEVHITKEGYGGAEMGKIMALGYAHVFVLSVVLSFILCGLEKSFQRWTCRVKFCAAIGLLVATCDLGAAIWWHHALGWTLAQAVYDLLMYVVIGLVLAKFVTSKPAPAGPAA
ncbi:MAG: hypothetical protein HZA93_07550 [Verrucomicrobia bacterium]|nr:hypothetical protein [Verrucomicrobiota bacterium]